MLRISTSFIEESEERSSFFVANNKLQLRRSINLSLFTGGGVEDTRLDAKAKDTKKIRGQGQGQPFRRQTLSRPRTEMLEAKAKDQGHKCKCSPKQKKGLHKSFLGDLQIKKKKRSSQKFFKRSPQKKCFPKHFSSASQNFNNSKNSAVLEPRTGQFSRT